MDAEPVLLVDVDTSTFAIVTVGSDGPKNSVPQRGIEPWSFAFRASVITARPPRHLSAVTFTPLWGKRVLTL